MKLIIGNSLSRLEGLTDDQYRSLRQILSYTSGSYFGGRGPQKRYLLDKKGNFPTGLLPLVKKWLEPMKYPAEVIDTRVKPQPSSGLFTLKLPYPAYPEQIAASEAAITANRGIVSAPTGSGKSYMIALTIAAASVPTLVVVPSLELKKQLGGDLKRYFGNSPHIRVENVDALDIRKPLKGYDAVIIDEFHHGAATTYRKLNLKCWNDVYFKFGFTATPFRSRDEEQLLLESVLSEVIYEIPYQYCVDNKRIVPIEAYYVDVPSLPMKGNSNSWQAVYSELVVNNPIRNAIIVRLMKALDGIPTLCLIKEIAHGEALAAATGAPFANGQAANTRELILEFILGESTQLIGTTGVIGEGIDTKPAEYAILAAGGKAKGQFMQQVGRVLRLHPGKDSGKVILFRDSSNKWLLAHYKAQVKVLKDEYNIIPSKLEV